MPDSFAYDVLEYPSHVHPQMHPSRLAAIARLHGIAAASPTDCRLLEVGCGDGLQLVTLAMAYPRSRFVGVDMSQAAIARGEAIRARLGLDNLQLVAADLLEWNAGPVPYDYIVAHGFYSWVPDFVRERLLALCDQAMAPAGIAYVSYNALPGCHIRRMVWEMMKFHARDIDDPHGKIEHAQGFLAWLGHDALPSKLVYGEVVRHEARELLSRTDSSVLFHDDMAAINQPFLFSEFAAQARRHGLAYLAEADYFEMNDKVLESAEARERLSTLAGDDPLLKEQYLDFLKGRRFRQTLLCHERIPVQRDPSMPAALEMDVVAQLRAEIPEGTAPDLAAGVAIRFSNADGAALVIDHPVAKAALTLVGEAFPGPVAAAELLQSARKLCVSDAAVDDDAAVLAHTLTAAFQMGLLLLHCDAPRFATQAGEHPRTSALAQLQLDAGTDLVTSLRPSMVRLDSRLALELVRLLDGKRDRAAILHDLSQRMAALPMPDDAGGETFQPVEWWQQQLAGKLEDGLQQTARMALLAEE